MIRIIPEQHRQNLSMAIARGDLHAVKKIVEQHALNVDSFLDNESYHPVVMDALLSYGFNSEEERLLMLHYLLKQGANPNTNCKARYNCLHIAVQQDKLTRALDLFLDFNGDVNITDNNSANIVYWAIQSFPWRKTGEERQVHLNILEKILMLGGDLDWKNRYGVTPRQWLERAPDDVKKLVARCEELKPAYKPSFAIQPKFPDNLKYPDVAKTIWNNLVPLKGQAASVQGELLRAIEKLRDEAQRNGNINYMESHKLLAKFAMDTLINSGLFDKSGIAKIKSDTKKLMKAASPYVDDDIYDYLTDCACLFYLSNKEIIGHEHNSNIDC